MILEPAEAASSEYRGGDQGPPLQRGGPAGRGRGRGFREGPSHAGRSVQVFAKLVYLLIGLC